MDLITKYKTRIAELQRKQKTFEAKGLGGACISLQGEIQAYNTVICDLAREGYKPDLENSKLPIPRVRFQLPSDQEIIEIAILFNDGEINTKKLTDMVAMCQFVIDRLYENGDISKQSSKEGN